MSIYIAAGVVVVIAVIFLVIALAVGSPLANWASPVIAIAALGVALAALGHSAKSADADARSAALAEQQELNRRYGWAITLRPDGQTYELRNLGTITARHVRLSGDFRGIAFLGRQRDEAGEAPVDIAPGEARAFQAYAGWSDVGEEVTITWTPNGGEERTWVDVVPVPPGTMADRRQERIEEQARKEQQHREDAREVRELILRLGDAYAEWKSDQNNPEKKLRVQLLVAALPPDLGREIGHQVDVARDVWGPSEYPFVDHVCEEDKEIIDGMEAEIELMWNMRSVAGYSVYGPKGVEGPDTEPRIWWALMGYADRVRERRSGERRLRDSPFDARSRREAEATFAGMREWQESREGQVAADSGDSAPSDDQQTGL